MLFGALWVELENQYTQGTDQFPADPTAAYSLLINIRVTRPPNTPRPVTSSPPGAMTSTDVALTFAQAGSNPVQGTDGVVHAHIMCYQCNSKGHYTSACPLATGVQMLHATHDNVPDAHSEFTFEQHGRAFIPDTWILLDSQSTVSVFKNPQLLSNIQPSAHLLTVHTNGGTQISTSTGHLANFGPVWYNPNLLANILSLAAVRKLCCVTMDSDVEAALCVHCPDGPS